MYTQCEINSKVDVLNKNAKEVTNKFYAKSKTTN